MKASRSEWKGDLGTSLGGTKELEEKLKAKSEVTDKVTNT